MDAKAIDLQSGAEKVTGSLASAAPALTGRWQAIVAALGMLLTLGVIVLDRRWILLAMVVAVTAAMMVVGMRHRPVRLAFEVGEGEKHAVVFEFNKFWGSLRIAVDGEMLVRELRIFSASPRASWEFSVGTFEPHLVRIEKRRALVLAGARPQPVRAYVDGVLAAEGVA